MNQEKESIYFLPLSLNLLHRTVDAAGVSVGGLPVLPPSIAYLRHTEQRNLPLPTLCIVAMQTGQVGALGFGGRDIA